jgi:membrane protein required for colicin V production
MHVLDIIIGIIAAVLVFNGIRRGLIGEIFRLTAMIAGCFIAFLYYQEVAALAPLRFLTLHASIKNGIAFFLIYLVCLIAIIALGWIVRKAVHLTPLVWVDRLTGGVIGLFKALLIAYVACLSISSLPVKRIRSDFNRSVVYSTFTRLPQELSLRSLLLKRGDLRRLFFSKEQPDLNSLHRKFEKFRTAVDSVQRSPK